MSDSQIRTGVFQADGGLINLPLGFIPDYFKLMDLNTSTNIVFYEWWQRQEADMATGLQEGVSITEGVTARLADAGGITAYNTGSQQPASGTGAGQLAQWVASTSYTARTATAAGSYVIGTTSGTDDTGAVVDRSAIFECVTAGTSGSTEPVWPSAIGGQVTDSTPVWEKVNTATFRAGYQGVTIAAALMTNSRFYFYLAVKAHHSEDHGDVDGWPSGVDTNWT